MDAHAHTPVRSLLAAACVAAAVLSTPPPASAGETITIGTGAGREGIKDAGPSVGVDVARAADDVARAGEAARMAAEELARAVAVEQAARDRAQAAQRAADQAVPYADQAEDEAVQAEADAQEAARQLTLIAASRAEPGTVAQARLRSAEANSAAAVARAAADAARADVESRWRAANEASQAYWQACAARANAETGSALAANDRAAAMSAYNAAMAVVLGRDLKAGEAALQSEDYSAAFRRLTAVTAAARNEATSGFAERARTLIQKIEDVAAGKLGEARLRKLRGDDPGALAAAREVLERFAFSRAAEGARALLADPRLAALSGLAEAEELDRARSYSEAIAAYRELVRSHPESVPAFKARLRLEAMAKDPTIAAVLKEAADKAADASCPGWLIMARNYRDNGRPEEARELLRKVIASSPDSDYAREAGRMLEELPAAKS